MKVTTIQLYFLYPELLRKDFILSKSAVFRVAVTVVVTIDGCPSSTLGTAEGGGQQSAVWTGVKHTETLIKNTESIPGVGWVVIGIITLAGGKTGLKI